MKYYCQHYKEKVYFVWNDSFNQADIDERLVAQFSTMELNKKEYDLALVGEGTVVNGVFTKILKPSSLTKEELMLSAIRKQRNERLLSSDWTQVPDNNLTEEKKLEWKNYRQALRDMSNTYAFDDSKVFPSEYFPDKPI